MKKDTFHVKPGEPVMDALTDRLRQVGHPKPEAWQEGLNPDAYRTNDQNLQRFFINRRLRSEIGRYEDDTLAIRTCLIDDGDLNADWARYIDKVIIPCLVQHSTQEQSA